MLNEWFRETLISTGVTNRKSVLYEDELVRITLSADYRAHQGRITMLIYNKTGADILNFKAVFPSYNYLTIRAQDAPNRIVPAEEGKIMIAVDSMRPFAESPTFDMTFSIGQAPYKYPLRLPVSITSFCEALPTDKDTYMSRWKSIAGEGLEAQEVFFSSKPINPQTLAYIRTTVFQGLHIGIASGLDNENTATGSASFRTGTAGADGNLIAVGVMLRLEGDPSQHRFRVTIRGKHALVVQGMRAAIKAVLERE